MRAFALLPLLLLAACSFTTATGFEECQTTSDCASGKVCSQNYCISVDCTEAYGATDAGNAIAIGAAIPFTDSTGQTDQSERADFDAVVLALNEINQPGRSPRPFALYACDTHGDATQLASNGKAGPELSYLIDQKKVAAVITSNSSQTLAAAPVTVASQVLLLSATSTAAEISSTPATAALPDGGSVRMIWRTAPSDAIQGRVIADAIATGGTSYQPDGGDPYLGGISRVGILYVDDPYGQGLSEVVSAALPAGITQQSFQYERGGDAGSAVDSLDAFNPDLTVAIGFPDDLVNILNRADGKTNLSPASNHRWFFTDSAKDPALLSGLTDKTQLENALGSTPAQGAGPAFASFANRFQTAFSPLKANDYSFTGHSYDMMYLLALGSGWAMGPGPDYSGAVTGPAIADGLAHVSGGFCPGDFTTGCYQLFPGDFTGAVGALGQHQTIDVDGASGNLNFDPATGEAPSPIEIWRVQGSGFTDIAAVNPP